MNEVDTRIIKFISKHHIFTLATANDNIPYTCTCFYIYMESENRFIFTSDRETRHVAEMALQPMVSGAIALETSIIGRIQGVQFTGIASELSGEEYRGALKAYLHRFPYAGFKHLLLWSIEPDFIKMTHNQLGFGKKITWKKELQNL